MFYNQPQTYYGTMPPPPGGYVPQQQMPPQQMSPQQWQQVQQWQQQQMQQQQAMLQQQQMQQQMAMQRQWQQPRAVPTAFPSQMGYQGYPQQMPMPMQMQGGMNQVFNQQPWTSGNLDGRSVGSGFSRFSGNNTQAQQPMMQTTQPMVPQQTWNQGMSQSDRYLASISRDNLPASVKGQQRDERPLLNQSQQSAEQERQNDYYRAWAKKKQEDDERERKKHLEHMRQVANIAGMSEEEYQEYIDSDTDEDEEDFDMQAEPTPVMVQQQTMVTPTRTITIDKRKKRRFVLVNSTAQRGEIAAKKDFVATTRKPYITAPNTTYQALAKVIENGKITYEPVNSEEGLTEEELDRGRHYINRASLALKEVHPIKAQRAEVQVLSGDEMVSAPERKKEVIQDRASKIVVHETEDELSVTEAILDAKFTHKKTTKTGDGVCTAVKTSLRKYFIAKQDKVEILSTLSQATTFKELQIEINRLLASNDVETVEFVAQLDRYLTQELEKLIHVKMGLYGISFGSFADDAVELIRHIEGKFGQTFGKAITSYQSTFIKSLLEPSVLDLDEEDTSDDKYYGVGVKKNTLIAYVDIDADSLNVGTVDNAALLVSNSTLPNLYDFIKELFKNSPEAYTRFIVTNDERIFELNKGLIDAGAEIPSFLIQEVKLYR